MKTILYSLFAFVCCAYITSCSPHKPQATAYTDCNKPKCDCSNGCACSEKCICKCAPE